METGVDAAARAWPDLYVCQRVYAFAGPTCSEVPIVTCRWVDNSERRARAAGADGKQERGERQRGEHYQTRA
jgi:hypothetical protein